MNRSSRASERCPPRVTLLGAPLLLLLAAPALAAPVLLRPQYRLQATLEPGKPQVEGTLETLRKRYGYCDDCAQDAIRFLLRRRYD